MQSQREPDDSSRASPSARGRMGSVYGRSRAGTRSAIPTTCGERLCLLAAAATLTLLLCGCDPHRQDDSAVVTRGKDVFAVACASCHTLTGHDSRARGGDLAMARLSTRSIT